MREDKPMELATHITRIGRMIHMQATHTHTNAPRTFLAEHAGYGKLQQEILVK